MNITITGNLGSGKSSVCKQLEERGMNIISSGTLFRQIAEEKHLSVTELNELAKTDKSVDNLLDQRNAELGKKLDNTVFDSRLGWHFIPNSFKVFFIVNTKESANRVFQDNRPTEHFQTQEEAIIGLQKRASLEKERYVEIYHVNYYDLSNYDLVIDTTYASPEQIADTIQNQFEEYQKSPFDTRLLFDLRSVYPTQVFRYFNPQTLSEYIQKENQQEGTIALEKLRLSSDGNCFYLEDGHHHVYAALASGKCFGLVDSIVRAKDKIVLSKNNYYDFEDFGHFCFKFYPTDDTKYFFADFSNLSIYEQSKEKKQVKNSKMFHSVQETLTKKGNTDERFYNCKGD